MKKILTALLLLPSVALAASLQSETFFQNSGGLIDHVSPLLVPNTHASAINNITLDDRGQLSKRNGYTVIQSTFAMVGFSTWTVNGGTFHKAAAGGDFFAVVVGTAVYRITNSFSSYSPVSGTANPTATATNLAQAAHLNDKAIFCNDVDKPFYVASTGDATQISTNTISAAKTCATYGSYLVFGNTTESSTAYPTRVRWSAINDVNSLPPLNYIDVEPDDGDAIVGVVAFDESVYIFKKRSIYQMLITGLDGPDAFIIRPVSRNIGAWAKQSIKAIPNVGIIFLSQNTVYILSDSGLTPVGDPIQRTLDNVQRTMWGYAIGEVYPKRFQYWLAVSTAGSTNTQALVYDYVQNNWTTYSGMRINMLAQAEDSNGNNVLISGDYGAVTYKQDNGSTDNPGGTATAIAGSYTTANIHLGHPEITKTFKYLYLFTVGDQNYTLQVKAAYDLDSNYESTQDIDFGSSGAVYDTGVYDVDMYPSSGYGTTRIELNRSAKLLRLQFNNSASGEIFGLVGWVVVYSLEDYDQ